MGKEIWKRSTLCKKHFVSNLGRVRDPNGNIVRPFLNKKKGYLRYIIEKKFIDGKRFISGHRIIITEFKDNPNNFKQINHIDGNKQNNREDNLEWISGSKNVIHSMENNLRKDNLKIIVTDLVKRLEYKYLSINEFYNNMVSENTNTPGMIIPEQSILAYVFRTRHKPYLNRYVIELDKNSTLSTKYNSIEVCVYCHFNNTWSKYLSYNHMALNTGIKSSTVMDYLKNKVSVYYAGHTFSMSKNIILNKIDINKAKADYNTVLSLENKIQHKAFLIYDYVNNVEIKFDNMKDVSEFLSYDSKYVYVSLYRSIMRNRSWLVNGYGIKPYGVDMKWTFYNKEELLNSKHRINWTRPIYRVKETSKLIFGNEELIKVFNLDSYILRRVCDDKNKLKKYLEHLMLTVNVTRVKFE